MDIFVICIYALTLIIIGIRASGGVESLKDYAASTKKYSVFPLTATMCSALIGGGFSIGNADISASTGVGNSLAMLGFCVGTLIVAVFIVPKINIEGGNEIYSLGSLMRNSYGDISGVVSSIFSFLFCVCVLAVQISALGGLVCAFTGWTMGFSSLVGVLFIMVYSLVGGMKSVVSTDILQFLVLCVGVPLLTVFSLKGVGGVDGMVEAVPHHYFNPLSSMTVIEFASLFITFMIGETLVPPVVQRLYNGL